MQVASLSCANARLMQELDSLRDKERLGASERAGEYECHDTHTCLSARRQVGGGGGGGGRGVEGVQACVSQEERHIREAREERLNKIWAPSASSESSSTCLSST